MKTENITKWVDLLKDIFNDEIPREMEWSDTLSIIEILNKIGKISQLNHMFLPSGGGVDLTKAQLSTECGCIELTTDGGNTMILKPKQLSFNWYGQDNAEWSYFRLETAKLEPSGVYDDYDKDFYKKFQFEEVTELSPGQYVDRNVWDAGYFRYDENGEKSLPNEARTVGRIFSGDFVIFPKQSFYNVGLSDAYDARHNKMLPVEFKDYIQKIILKLKENF